MAKDKTFLLIWRTTTSKYQIVTGRDIAEACNNAGIGGGAIRALDYYADISKIPNGKSLQKVMREIKEYEHHGYYWKRETCAKIAKLCDAILAECQHPGLTTPYKGWKPGPAFDIVYTKFCKEE